MAAIICQHKLAHLNAIRYDLNGDGARGTISVSDWANYTNAFPNTASGMGYPSAGCVGYELTASLDFDSDADDDVDANDHGGAYWDSGAGWTPIGASAINVADRYSGDFKGNGHTINNLFISRSGSAGNDVGLFGSIHFNARLETVGVINADVTANQWVGILVGSTFGSIVASYTTGLVSGVHWVGGLTSVQATSSGQPIRSDFPFTHSTYSTASVSGPAQVSSLIGTLSSGSVSNSYSTSRVTGTTQFGGLIGVASVPVVSNSYRDTVSSGQTTSADGSNVVGKTPRELQTVDDYTGIYADWNANLDGAADPWDFGNGMQYPMLKYDGMSTAPQGGLAMGIPDNWHAPVAGECQAVCLVAGPSLRGAVPSQTWLEGWGWERSDNGGSGWTVISGADNNAPTYNTAPPPPMWANTSAPE